MGNSILVSVVIPVYNVELYLSQCLESLLSQTLKEIEIICVDDGSTDSSLDILDIFASKDNRIKVLKQKNQGTGIARNTGMDVASGDYIIFLDSDDFFDATMLAEMYQSAVENQSDVVVCKFRQYNNTTGKYTRISKGINYRKLQNISSFSALDYTDILLDFTTTSPWNKLFRREFIIENGLRFLGTKRANDGFVILSAITLANTISLVNKELLTYRVGLKTNLQSNIWKSPLDVYTTHKHYVAKIQSTHRWDLLRVEVINRVLHGCLGDANRLKQLSKDAYVELIDALRCGGFRELGVVELGRNGFKYKSDYYQYKMIEKGLDCKAPYSQIMSLLSVSKRYTSFISTLLQQIMSNGLRGFCDIVHDYLHI